MQQKTIVFEAHPIDALEETCLVPLSYVNAVEIKEDTCVLHAAGNKFLVSRAEWDAATVQK